MKVDPQLLKRWQERVEAATLAAYAEGQQKARRELDDAAREATGD